MVTTTPQQYELYLQYRVVPEPGRHVHVQALNDLTFEVIVSKAAERDVDKLRMRLLQDLTARGLSSTTRGEALVVSLAIRDFYERRLKAASADVWIEWAEDDEARRASFADAYANTADSEFAAAFGFTKREGGLFGFLHWSLGDLEDTDGGFAHLDRRWPLSAAEVREALTSTNRTLARLADRWVLETLRRDGADDAVEAYGTPEGRLRFLELLDERVAELDAEAAGETRGSAFGLDRRTQKLSSREEGQR